MCRLFAECGFCKSAWVTLSGSYFQGKGIVEAQGARGRHTVAGASTNIAVFPQSREHRSHEDHGVIQYIGMHGLCLHVSLRVCL